MPEYVRIREAQTGAQITVSRDYAEAYPEGLEILDKPAVNADGRPLPNKLRVLHGAAKAAFERRAAEELASVEAAGETAESTTTETPEEG